MRFDARAAKLIRPGTHMIVEGCPGLWLVATASGRIWTYRYKSPADGRMRQVALGAWPAMSLAAVAGAWAELRAQRDAGQDPAQSRRAARLQAVADARRAGRRGDSVYMVRDMANDYLRGPIAHLA